MIADHMTTEHHAAPGSMPPKKTPLYDRHVQLGARVIDFGGWAMPVQYSSILEEHKAVRTAVGLFDVCHMGEVEFTGPGALAAVERLVSNDVRRLQIGQARYTVVCYPDGGIVDDCIVYKRGEERLQIVINAANIDKDVAWFRDHIKDVPGCTFQDQSPRTGLIAVQGPRAAALADRVIRGGRPSELPSFFFLDGTVEGHPVTAARTGYTGEDGFEIFCAAGDAVAIWDRLLEAGQDLGVRPCGLGARDTLRLEACLSLYGNDIDATTTPYEAGLSWVVKLDHDFIGRDALAKQKAEGLSRRLVAFVMEGRGTARHGYDIIAAAGDAGQRGEKLGIVTSGSIGPTVGKNLGLGYVPLAFAEPGSKLLIDCRGKDIPAHVVKGPFYKRPATGG